LPPNSLFNNCEKNEKRTFKKKRKRKIGPYGQSPAKRDEIELKITN